MKKFFKNFYLLLIFLFLYAPIVVLMIFSFNDSKSRIFCIRSMLRCSWR